MAARAGDITIKVNSVTVKTQGLNTQATQPKPQPALLNPTAKASALVSNLP